WLMRTLPTLLLTLAASLLASRGAPAQVPPPTETGTDTAAADGKLLRDHKVQVEPASLLDYLRKRTYPDVEPKRVAALLRHLGDRSFRVREQAHADLTALGTSALAALREAELAPDHEIRRRALAIRLTIERKADPITEAAVARLLAVRKPDD